MLTQEPLHSSRIRMKPWVLSIIRPISGDSTSSRSSIMLAKMKLMRLVPRRLSNRSLKATTELFFATVRPALERLTRWLVARPSLNIVVSCLAPFLNSTLSLQTSSTKPSRLESVTLKSIMRRSGISYLTSPLALSLVSKTSRLLMIREVVSLSRVSLSRYVTLKKKHLIAYSKVN